MNPRKQAPAADVARHWPCFDLGKSGGQSRSICRVQWSAGRLVKTAFARHPIANRLQQYTTRNFRASARISSGNGAQLGRCICTQPKELDMSSTQARSKMTRLDVIRLLAISMLLILPATSKAQQSAPIAEQIAKAYGLDSFGQIEAIRYTWSAEFPGGQVSRKWEWSPKTDTVSYEGKDKEGKPVKATYQRSQLDSQSDVIKKEIDPAFSNDQYWLLLPFHVAWDGAAVTDDGTQKLPLGDGSAQRVVAKYPSDGGYQPGDTWD